MLVLFSSVFLYYKIIAELTEWNKLTLISSFISLLSTKGHMGKQE